MQGPAKLPGYDEMMDDINRKREALAQRYVAGSLPDVRVEAIPYMDEQFGAKPKLSKSFQLRDHKAKAEQFPLFYFFLNMIG